MNVYFSCNNWFTSNVKILITTIAAQPFLDGESFGEQALNFFKAKVDAYELTVDVHIPEHVSVIGCHNLTSELFSSVLIEVSRWLPFFLMLKRVC